LGDEFEFLFTQDAAPPGADIGFLAAPGTPVGVMVLSLSGGFFDPAAMAPFESGFSGPVISKAFVPEPASMGALLVGALALIRRRRFRRS